jgi:hypothetical protein
MVIKKIEVQDSKGNVYYPYTESSVVKYGYSNVGNTLKNLEQLSNTNILINSNFRINQRNQEQYVVDGSINSSLYTVDRWISTVLTDANAEVVNINKLDNCIELVPISGGVNGEPEARLKQILEEEDTKMLRGKTLTFSLKVLEDCSDVGIDISSSIDNNIYSLAFVNIEGGDILSYTFEVPDTATNLGVQFKTSGINNSLKVEWTKLEIGEKVTPYYPRKYVEELTLCQRYYQIGKIDQCLFTTENGQLLTNIHLSTPMRILPIMTLCSKAYFHKYDGGDPILLKDEGDVLQVEGFGNYYNHLSCWIYNDTTTAPSEFADRLIGTINSNSLSDNSLSSFVVYTLDAEIY